MSDQTYIITSFALPRQDREPEGYESLFTSFELGWEVTTSHLLAKHMFATGLASRQTHRVVCIDGREFLYQGACEVVPWSRFYAATQYDPRWTLYGNVVDLARQFAQSDVSQALKVFYGSDSLGYRFAKDRAFIAGTIAAEPVEAVGPFAVACWRYRDGHFSCRNTPKEVADAINAALVSRGYTVYVVGLGTESLCNGVTVRHCTLPQMAWLVQHQDCAHVVGAMTGTTQLAALLTEAPVSVYQHNPRQPVNCQNHPAVLGQCVNLRGNVRRVWFADESPVEEFLAAI